MGIKELMSHVDHTLLAQTATWEEIRQICDDAVAYQTASVCIPPSFVKQAKEYMGDKMAVCTVIGFPNGYMTTETKEFETRNALENGADDYITKPFSATYLKAKIENILRARKKLQEYYASHSTDNKNSETKSPDQPVLNSRDQKFIDTITVVLEKELDNSDFTIDELVSQVGLGRTVFFKKLKALTGLSPVEYIREFRLTRATELICNDEYNISQISYMVGISDPRYFSRCFKQKYGMTPTEYKDKIQGKNK